MSVYDSKIKFEILRDMKKGIILAIAVSSVVLFSACTEDPTVTGTLTQEKLSEVGAGDPDKVYSSQVAGIYSDFQSYVATDMSHNYFGQKSFDYLTSLMGNDMVMTGRFAMSLYHYLLDYGGENYVPTSNRWAEYYRHIDNANKILATISVDETNPAVLKYKAIALTTRGYAYWQLTNLYQFAYKVGVDGSSWGKPATNADNSQELCVPIVTETITGEQPRSTVEQVYTQLLGDLEAAYAIFNDIGMVKTSSATDIDGCVAAMYLARAYMVKQDWTNALKYSQVVKSNYEILTAEADIMQGFSDIALKNVVFGCDITADNSGIYMSYFSMMDFFGDGYAGNVVWRAGFKPFVDRIPATDIRSGWFADIVVPCQSIKFVGAGRENVDPTTLTSVGWELGDYLYLRSEEAYFMEMEAKLHQGDGAGALALLQEFMASRDSGYAFNQTSKAELLAEINFQKRVEFWGEGIEFLDNRRLNIPVDRTAATWPTDNNNHESGQIKAEQTDTRFRYQLPIKEIETNKFITPDDQNKM